MHTTRRARWLAAVALSLATIGATAFAAPTASAHDGPDDRLQPKISIDCGEGAQYQGGHAAYPGPYSPNVDNVPPVSAAVTKVRELASTMGLKGRVIGAVASAAAKSEPVDGEVTIEAKIDDRVVASFDMVNTDTGWIVDSYEACVDVLGKPSSGGDFSTQSDYWNYIDRRWAGNSVPFATGNLSYFNGGGTAVSVSQSAMISWNWNGPFNYWNAGADWSRGWDGNPCNYNGGVWVLAADHGHASTLAYASYCATWNTPLHTITGVAIVMNTNSLLSWAVTSAVSIDSWRYDYWSTLTHEAGHAWGHVNHFEFYSDPECPISSGVATMCDGILQGVVWQRTPQVHENEHQNQVYT